MTTTSNSVANFDVAGLADRFLLSDAGPSATKK